MTDREESWEREYLSINECHLVGAMRQANHVRVTPGIDPYLRTQAENRIELLRQSVQRFHAEVPKYWSHELAALRQA